MLYEVITIPIGAEDNFAGVVDLIKMKAIFWDEASQGMKFEYKDIPAELEGLAQEWREKMVETAAEASEELMNKYVITSYSIHYTKLYEFAMRSSA